MRRPIVLSLSTLFVALLLTVPAAADEQTDLVKWSQMPDMGPYGYDFSSESSFFSMVADDFLCSNSLAVTDVHWWGSYYQPGALYPYPNSDNLPDPTLATMEPVPGMLQGFFIEFYTDIPAGTDPFMPWSHPGTVLYEQFIPMTQVIETFYGQVEHLGGVLENVWQYNVDLPTPFNQDPDFEPQDIDGDGTLDGTVYWIKIQAAHYDPYIQWGWHEADTLWHDNAVQHWPPNANLPAWVLLPNKDMAFELTFIPEPSVLILAGFGVLALLLRRRRR